MRKLIALGLIAPMLVGCASRPSEIAPAYVSPALYQNLSCPQLAAEAQRVAHNAAIATGQQQQRATRDTVAMTAGLIIFWPALFFIRGDSATSAEVARLKGEAVAIEQASTANSCGIQFHQS